MESNSSERKEDAVEPAPAADASANTDAPAVESNLEAAIAESQSRLANEPQVPPRKRGGARRGAGRKKADAASADGDAPKKVEGDVLPKAVEIPSMVPQFTKGVMSLSQQLAARRDFPGYALTPEQAEPLAKCLDACLLRYAPGISTSHPELSALVITAALTFGPIVLADLADKDERQRKAMAEARRQYEMQFQQQNGKVNTEELYRQPGFEQGVNA